MANVRQQKKEKFSKKRKSKTPLFVISGLLVVIIGVSIYLMSSKGNSLTQMTTADLGHTVTYSETEQLQQTVTPNTVDNGNLVVTSLANLGDKKFIWTEYNSSGKRVPVTAVVQPDGKILAAVSLCEPCQSETFHITGNQIICNACGTSWDLQTLKPVGGACQSYPPQALTYSVKDGNLLIPQSELDSWAPRS